MRAILFAFLLIPGGLCLAEADGPDAWKVFGVSNNSSLNMRKGPSTEFPVVAKLPDSAIDLKNLGCYPEFNLAEWQNFTEHERQLAVKLRWCRVQFKGISGWVYGQYLQEY